MEASQGFPWDCPTNAYVLDGFGHVVYMVSTVAGNSAASDASVHSRLRNAERELRSLFPLVFLDLEANELFTFHRVIEFQKDGKNIYGRTARVLQQNQCINSFKSALRAFDLMKEEHARLRGILFSAVLSSLGLNFLHDNTFIPLGMRSFLRSQSSSDDQSWDRPAENDRRARGIEIVDLQLLPHGQLLVLNVSQKLKDFYAVSDVLAGKAEEEGILFLHPGTLCLVPTGQMARYTDGQILSGSTEHWMSSRPRTSTSEQQKATHLTSARLESWREHLLLWLAEQGVNYTDLNGDFWVEIEIIMSWTTKQEAMEGPKSNTGQLVWKRLFWPARLCFYTQSPQTRLAMDSNIPSEDPVTFVHEWIRNSDERAREVAQEGFKDTDVTDRQEHQHLDNMDEEHDFGSTPHMHNAFSAGLPPSQLMYPTPPDVPYTQATPGMSSVDGIGMTPADTTRVGPAAVEQQADTDMLDQMDASGVGTGTYDEDLFEDLPTNRFGAAGATDEPDWDFFEQHDAGVSHDNPQNDNVETRTQESPSKIEAIPEDTKMSVNRHTATEESMLPPQTFERASAQSTMSPPTQDSKEVSRTEEDTIVVTTTEQGDIQVLAAVDVPVEIPSTANVESETQVVRQTSDLEIWKKPALPHARGRRRSLYDSSEDLTVMGDHDERYAANGAFWFDSISENQPKAVNEQDSKAKGGKAQHQDHAISSPRNFSDKSSESASSTFDQVDYMDLDEEDLANTKRKWTEYEQNPNYLQLGPTAEELDEFEDDTRRLLKLLRPNNLDQTWILDNSIEASTAVPIPAVQPNYWEMSAQILVDQFTQTFLPHGDEITLQISSASDEQVENLKAIDGPYGRIEPATFASLTKANEGAAQNDATSRLQSLERHELCLFRTDKNLLVSPTALPLWETLNLQPMGGRKDVQAYCIHPTSANLENGCSLFLERLGETYVSCNFGDHGIGQIAGISQNGLVSWSDQDETTPKLKHCCERLGTALARLPATSKNIVIYMITAPSLDWSPVALIDAFCVLFHAYAKACNKQHSVELVLQIVPVEFVASPGTLVIRSPQEYMKLAIEVYNRCPPAEIVDKRAFCASAVVLGESPRRRIRFDMAGHVEASSDVGVRCLHVSYSCDRSQRWIVTSWTDERGFRALTMCYPLKLAGKHKARPRSDIIRDVCEVSQELMAKERRRWRLVIAKDGFYETSEVNEWATQFNRNTSTTKCTLVLLSVDLDPSLAPQMPAAQPKASQVATPQQPLPNYGTPVSTPQASTTSPDQYLTATPTPSGSVPLNAPTPPEVVFDPNHETDLTVRDATEESWSVVLPFGLNQSREVLNCRPAMLSGFLLKRRGVRDEDGLSKLGVNLIHTSTLWPAPTPTDDDAKRKGMAAAMAAAREELLRDILGQFRGLVTLARSRGCIDAVNDVVPWHVATAIKGARVLGKWM